MRQTNLYQLFYNICQFRHNQLWIILKLFLNLYFFFQMEFLYLFQVHFTWPAIVTEAWWWLTEFASLAWFRLEFLFYAVKSLCTKQYVPPSATLLAPFIMFFTIYSISEAKANPTANKVKNNSSTRAPKTLHTRLTTM